MRVAITGTPGTGKTTVAGRLVDDPDLEVDLPLVNLNDVVRQQQLWTERDDDRDSLVVDVEAVESSLGVHDCIVEGHFAHLLDADMVVVLRCHPDELRRRLTMQDPEDESIEENVESEALDGILTEAVEIHGRENVYEIDTTDRSKAEVAAAVAAVINGEREPSAGTVDFTDYL